jgi:hypothetical protein
LAEEKSRAKNNSIVTADFQSAVTWIALMISELTASQLR